MIKMKNGFKITVFFLTYNEEKNIPDIISSAISVLDEIAEQYEILIVNYDGSTDRSEEIIQEYSKKDPRIRLVHQPVEMKGVGYAIKLGFENAKFENIFYTDGDNQFNMKDLKRLMPFVDDYDVIACYRINRQDPWLRKFTSGVYNLIVRTIFRIKQKDVDCAFRLVKKRIFQKFKLVCRTGLATSELLAKANRAGFRIKQLGVKHYPRKKGQSIFETSWINLPKPKVVKELIDEIIRLNKDLR